VIGRLPQLKEKQALDFIIVNGENAAGGRGITGKITIELLRAGVSVVTTGDHIWDQKDIIKFLVLNRACCATELSRRRAWQRINRPRNGEGQSRCGQCTRRTFMQPILENPFRAVEATVMKMREETTNIIVDAHGETTSEKIALGRFLDGKVSAVIGTHTHVQTADEQIFPGGTAFMCDAGMCGPVNSILGARLNRS